MPSENVGHGTVKSLVKLSEDGFNAVIKIPYKISVPKTYATASEVATLTFLRPKGFPVPAVYGWSSTSENEVGVDYIIMEHAKGVGADTRWFETTKYEKKALVIGIVDIEKRLFDIPFAPVGSLYFREDIPSHLQGQLYQPGTLDERGDSDTYCIAPITDYMFWYGQRAKLDLDRGPWTDPKQYLLAIANKEVQWTKRFGKPIECDFPHNVVLPGVKSHEDFLVLLRRYLAISPYLIPKDPEDILNRPTLRHPDLTPSNVFVCPDTFSSTCIIDWQHTVITPLLLAAGDPRSFENPDPEPPSGLIPPKYPENYDEMSSEDKAQVDELIRGQGLFYLYRVFNGGLNKLHLKALQDPLILSRQHLADFAGRQWPGNLMSLRGSLMRIGDFWTHVPGNDGNLECPVLFSEEELAEQSENEPMWYNLNRLVSHWRDELGGISEEGRVRTEKYDYAVKRNDAPKAEFSEGGSADELEKIKRGWPFQDREEFY